MNLPKGFLVNAVSSGIKNGNKLDLALIYSRFTAQAAGVFTSNKIKAAPLMLTMKHIKNNLAQAIIANSGNANCFTGKAGFEVAETTAKMVADRLGFKKNYSLVASTGIIAKLLPINKIKMAIPGLVNGLSRKGLNKVARAIMTTDTKLKIASQSIEIGEKKVRITGIAKGAGMIAPELHSATMLCFMMSDIAITGNILQKCLNEAVDNSFNCISIDGCMSTNDMVLILANGLAKNKPLSPNSNNLSKFRQALNKITLELAKKIVKDAEGATKFIEIKIEGAKSNPEAKKAALAIGNSVLFKTAMYGQNPNLGRVISALGQSGVELREERIKLRCSSLRKNEIKLSVNLNMGTANACVYTSDLTPEYVRINATYN